MNINHSYEQKPLRQKMVVLTGAGISAESGLTTFRDNNGLWKNNDAKKLARRRKRIVNLTSKYMGRVPNLWNLEQCAN